MIVGIAGIVIGVLIAWYCWTHESPTLRRKREGEEAKKQKEFQAIMEAAAVKLEAATEKAAVKAAEITIAKMQENQEQGRPSIPTEKEKVAQLAQASATAAMEYITGDATLFDPKLWVLPVSTPASMTTLDDTKDIAESDKSSDRG